MGGPQRGPAERGHETSKIVDTILTQMMADEFNSLWSEIQNYIAEADGRSNSCARLFRITW